MVDPRNALLDLTRRHFLQDCGLGVGKIALSALLADDLLAGGLRASSAEPPRASGGQAGLPHHRPSARRVIHLFMAGAPSQLDLFDHKPVLRAHDGEPVPQRFVEDMRFAFLQPGAKLLGPRFPFRRHGESGAEISDALPHLAKIADEIAIVRSMHTDQFNHAPAQIFLNTGSPLPGRPSLGAWVSWGLGSEASDLPGFVVLSSGGGTSGGMTNWSSGFLPTVHQGCPFRSKGDPILNVSSPEGVDAELQRASIDLVRDLDRVQLDAVGDPEIATRIEAYELAFRMQASAPELMDLSGESEAVLKMYGAEPGVASFAANCLLARRLCERGVRFVNVYHKGWDHHSNIEGGLLAECGKTDRACAALVSDLKQRGLLDDTLVVWGGEFGRTPMLESNAALDRRMGRDHHGQAFSMWLAGGGVQAGTTLGATDELGFKVVEDPVHVHDLQATILCLLGLDHERLTYRFRGREFRLTDVSGVVVEKLLA